ncbi:hypothetical protein PMAYCL1PPCAC_27632, partial [Pristionchus mayeri]
SRVTVMYHQVFGPVYYADPTYLVIASLFREATKGYAISAILWLAVDRWIATRSWSWYERQTASTIIVFLLLELAHLSISWTLSAFLIT